MHVTDDSRMKDVLQLTTTIVMASSAKKKNMTPKVLKHLEGGLLVTISLLKLMTIIIGPNLIMKTQDL